MIGPACIVGTFLFALFFSNWTLSSKPIREAEARSIISERKDAQFTVHQNRDGGKLLEITLPENPRIDLATPWNDSLRLALAQNGIACQTLIEDVDFHNGGVRGWLVLLSTFIVVAGTILLLRRPGTQKFYQQEIATPRAERREKRIAAVGVALAMIGVGLLLVLLAVKSAGRTISGAEARRVVMEHKTARFEVFQYADGSKALWITLPQNSWHHPTYVTSADGPALELLAENKISCETYVQGRDFGYRHPSRWLSLWCSFILITGAVMILWFFLTPKKPLPPTPGSLC
jgi:hypothetical protein